MIRRELLDVVVVGAGMVGSAAALVLARAGFRVALVEARAPKPWCAEEDVGLRVSALSTTSQRLLERLDIWPAIVAGRVSPYRRMRVWDEEGEIGFDAAEEACAELGHIVENALVADRLWAALQRESRIELHCPTKVTGLEQDEHQATVALDEGERLRARVVVAADGVGSPLRGLAGIETTGRDYRQKGLVLHVKSQLPHRETAWQRFLTGGPLALLPLSDGRCSIVWTRPQTEADQLLALSDDALSERLSEASSERLGRLDVASARAAFPLRLQLANAYSSGRLVLAGDAAHAVHPLAGQGVNLGFLDVVGLEAALLRARAADRDIGAPDVLRRYARARASENALAARGFDALERLFGHSHPAVAALRRQGLRLADRLPPLKRFFMRQAAGEGGGRVEP